MRPTAVESCFEIAFWLLDRATDDGEYLQPQKMHRMMFLSQAYYGALQSRAKLMPATFVAADEGPVEPTIFKAFTGGRPTIDASPVGEVPRHVLDSVWRQFGAHSADYLNKLIRGHAPYADAFSIGPDTEILFDEMVEFYGAEGLSRHRSKAKEQPPGAPKASSVLRPKMMRNHHGKPVNVNRWMPKRVD
jgi:uncharacterized phage-associated protein